MSPQREPAWPRLHKSLETACGGRRERDISGCARRSSTLEQATRGAGLFSACRARVFAERQPRPDVKPDRYVLAFAHHMLYEYGIARMLRISCCLGVAVVLKLQETRAELTQQRLVDAVHEGVEEQQPRWKNRPR